MDMVARYLPKKLQQEIAMIDELQLNHQDRLVNLEIRLIRQQFQEFVDMKQEGLIPEDKTFEEWSRRTLMEK